MADTSKQEEPFDRSETNQAELERVLTRAFDLPPASAAFQASLAQLLTREYAIRERSVQSPQLVVVETPEASPVNKSSQSTAAVKKSIPIYSRRWLRWGVAAACVLAVGMCWMGSPQYSWASMIAALEKNEWGQAVVQLDPGVVIEGWFSGEHRVVAVKTAGEVQFDNHATGTRLICIEGKNAITRQPIIIDTSSTMEKQFLRLILNSVAKQNAGPATQDTKVTVSNEQWQRTAAGIIELRVSLLVGESPARQLNVHFNIDPKTGLPMRGEVLVDKKERLLKFTYPTEGPRDIYVLGISKDLPIVASTEVRSMPIHATKSPDSAAAPGTARDLSELASSSNFPSKVVPPAAAISPVPKRELPPARPIEEMTERVDELMRQHWSANSINPVEPATDEEFMRRVYLDLLGRIPNISEARAFLKDARPNRRELLLDTLSVRYDRASHMAAVWRSFLIPETADLTALGGVGEFETWLTERFHNNQPYDQLVTELLLAEGRAKESGPLLFYAALKLQPEEIARQTSRAFLGLRLECAQCHDHFFDDHWKQRDFWGYAAFFARISQPAGKIERVSPVMRVRDSARGEVKLPNSEEIIPPRFPHEKEPVIAAENVSRRQLLTGWLTSAENPHFARATVNRVWSQMFGRGIVNPIDDMRVANEPLMPELLAELSDYFIRSGYDLRRLILTLARTEAYQLSSASDLDDVARRLHFAQMNVKCFTAEQLYDCVAVATRVDASSGNVSMDRLNRVNNFSRQAFLEQFRAPPGDATEYQAGIAQALTLMNGGLTHSATQLQTSGLLRSLRAPFFSDEQRIETLFLATVSRLPTAEESAAVAEHLNRAKDDEGRMQVLGDTLWALLNCAEFTLIH